MYLAQDKDKWRALVITIVSWATVSFSRRTMTFSSTISLVVTGRDPKVCIFTIFITVFLVTWPRMIVLSFNKQLYERCDVRLQSIQRDASFSHHLTNRAVNMIEQSLENRTRSVGYGAFTWRSPECDPYRRRLDSHLDEGASEAGMNTCGMA
jgi:hypothetical protein